MVALTAASVATCKAGQTEQSCGADTKQSRRVQYAVTDNPGDSGEKKDNNSPKRKDSIARTMKEDQSKGIDPAGRSVGKTSAVACVKGGQGDPATSSLPNDDCRGNNNSSHQESRKSWDTTTTTATPVNASARRDTLTLVSGMEVGSLDEDDFEQLNNLPPTSAKTDEQQQRVGHRHDSLHGGDTRGQDGEAGAIIRRRPNESEVGCADESGDCQPSATHVVADDPTRCQRRRREDETERIWRASLSDSSWKRRRNGNCTTTTEEEANDSKHIGGNSGSDVCLPVPKGGSQTVWANSSSSALTGARVDATAEGRTSNKISEEDNKPALLHAFDPSSRLDKLPAEVIASMLLLSDHKFAHKKIKASSANVLERDGQWKKTGNAGASRRYQLQPLPDLPYGFTDLGKRVNVNSSCSSRGETPLQSSALGVRVEGAHSEARPRRVEIEHESALLAPALSGKNQSII